MSETVKNMFTAISPTYDKLNHVLSFNIDKGWRRKAVSAIGHTASEPIKVLDVCAGTFDLSLDTLAHFSAAQITAVDFSSGMLQSGLAKIKGKNITPVCADALNLPFANAHFDVAVCGFGMRNLDDKTKALVELRRVLKPGGQLLVLEFFKPASFLSRLFNKTYAEHILPRLGKMISGNEAAYTYLRDSIRGFLTTDEFKALMQTQGYQNIKVQNFIFGIASCVSGVVP
jgi:ubiquinone/menaquinone biosynthesis methyltransferase